MKDLTQSDNQPNSGFVEVRVPASTSNFGSGFDCCGLALQLYLTVRAIGGKDSQYASTTRDDGFVDVDEVHGPNNLIREAMTFLAVREGFQLTKTYLVMRNGIPLASGLGSSAAAIIAGLRLASVLTGRDIPTNKLLRYATELEGHADNVAAALLGGWVIHCIREDGEVYAIKKTWPSDLKLIVVTPSVELETKRARSVLPETVTLRNAVYNMQRLALFNAAIDARNYDLLWEAMRDQLHQPYRRELMPGLSEALALPRREGLLGLALSGAGPSVLALTNSPANGLGNSIADCFRRQGIEATTCYLEVDTDGANSA